MGGSGSWREGVGVGGREWELVGGSGSGREFRVGWSWEFHMQSPPEGTLCYALTHGPDLTASPAICPPSTGVQLRTRPHRWTHMSAKTTPVGTHVSAKTTPMGTHVSDKTTPVGTHVSDKCVQLQRHNMLTTGRQAPPHRISGTRHTYAVIELDYVHCHCTQGYNERVDRRTA